MPAPIIQDEKTVEKLLKVFAAEEKDLSLEVASVWEMLRKEDYYVADQPMPTLGHSLQNFDSIIADEKADGKIKAIAKRLKMELQPIFFPEPADREVFDKMLLCEHIAGVKKLLSTIKIDLDLFGAEVLQVSIAQIELNFSDMVELDSIGKLQLKVDLSKIESLRLTNAIFHIHDELNRGHITPAIANERLADLQRRRDYQRYSTLLYSYNFDDNGLLIEDFDDDGPLISQKFISKHKPSGKVKQIWPDEPSVAAAVSPLQFKILLVTALSSPGAAKRVKVELAVQACNRLNVIIYTPQAKNLRAVFHYVPLLTIAEQEVLAVMKATAIVPLAIRADFIVDFVTFKLRSQLIKELSRKKTAIPQETKAEAKVLSPALPASPASPTLVSAATSASSSITTSVSPVFSLAAALGASGGPAYSGALTSVDKIKPDRVPAVSEPAAASSSAEPPKLLGPG